MNKIRAFFKKYWLEILVFSILAICFFVALSPNLTWMHVDSDGAEYVMDATYFYPAHHTSAPLYLVLGHLFLQIPYGTDYWRMSLMSAVFTIGAAIFVYLIIKHLLMANKNNRKWACLGAFIFGASALVFAQATIVETYAVVTFFSIAAYYFVLKKHWAWASSMLGMGLITHHLVLLTWIVLFIAHKEMRNWKRWGITFLFLLGYLYMPLSIMFVPNQPQMWGNTTIKDFFTNNISVFTMLVGQLSMYDLPKRIFDVLGVLGVSLGAALIPIGWWLWKAKKLKNELFWLFILPIIYVSTDLAYQIFKYLEASIAWGVIIAVPVLAQWWDGANETAKRFIKNKVVVFKQKLPVILKYGATYLTILVAVALLAVNVVQWDIGRVGSLDANLSATKFYYEELPKVADGEIFITMGAWEWIEAFKYNRDEGKHILPVCVGTLASVQYRDMLRSWGIKVDELDLSGEIEGRSRSNALNYEQVAYASYIMDNNPNVWTSRPTDPSTYGAEIVPAKGNEEQITRWLGSDVVEPQWQWIPNSPFSMISGDIEVQKWNFILQSNKSCLLLITIGMFCILLLWLPRKILYKKEDDFEASIPKIKELKKKNR
jgi:hypothetical protein